VNIGATSVHYAEGGRYIHRNGSWGRQLANGWAWCGRREAAHLTWEPGEVTCRTCRRMMKIWTRKET
jgi:hypothetical protein